MKFDIREIAQYSLANNTLYSVVNQLQSHSYANIISYIQHVHVRSYARL